MLYLVAFGAGLLRGYSGFGFAMLVVLGLLSRYPPAHAVPVALVLDVLCSVALFRGAAAQLHAGVLGRLVLGMLLAVPLGAWLLVQVPASYMAPVVALLCLCGGAMVLWRPQPASTWPLAAGWGAGLASGLATSVASAGGPPLIIYLLRSGLSPAQVRGTAVLFFLISSLCALLAMALSGVLGAVQWWLAASLLLPALAGNVLGQWLHGRWQPWPLRTVLGGVLVVLSLCSLLRNVMVAGT